jgi:hypothetical protein
MTSRQETSLALILFGEGHCIHSKEFGRLGGGHSCDSTQRIALLHLA